MKSYREPSKQEVQKEDNCCADQCIDMRGGNKVCLHCGLVLDVHLIEVERRAYSNEEIEKKTNRTKMERIWVKNHSFC
ncbi:MAG: hypothetical protein ACFE91_11465 [Promethearchaeota archaeon]